MKAWLSDWWWEHGDMVKFFSFLLLIVLVVWLVAAGTIHVIGKASCDNYADITGRTTQFDFWTGCYVQTDAGFIPQEEFTARAITNEN